MNHPFQSPRPPFHGDRWQDRAACKGIDDPEMFWPEKGNTTAEAKQLCRICPVKDECLEYALDHHERSGVWGGVSATDLKELKRQRRKSA